MKNELQPSEPGYTALLQLLRTSEAIWEASRIYFAQWDLSPSQFNILNLLRSKVSGVTQVDLSRELVMHRSNVTGLVDRLEKRKLVARQPDPTDRRVWTIVLGVDGEKLLQEILPDYFKNSARLWAGASAKEILQFQKQLTKLTQAAEEMAASFPR